MTHETKRARGWCFTLNNPTDDEITSVQQLECVYLIFGKEKVSTAHLQGYVYFANGKTLAAAKKFIPRAHLEIARGTPEQNTVYCSKDGIVFEKGTRPITDKEKGENEKVRAKRNLEALMEGRDEDVDIDIVATQLQKYQYGANFLRDARNKPVALEGRCFEFFQWHSSVLSGTGKTEYFKRLDPKPFIWTPDAGWNKYNYEEVVVMQDIDRDSKPTVHQIKLWCDKDPFQARILYGSKMIRPKTIIVLSNDTCAECYRGVGERHLSALQRRFEHFVWPEQYYLDGDEIRGELNPNWHLPDHLERETPGPYDYSHPYDFDDGISQEEDIR